MYEFYKSFFHHKLWETKWTQSWAEKKIFWFSWEFWGLEEQFLLGCSFDCLKPGAICLSVPETLVCDLLLAPCSGSGRSVSCTGAVWVASKLLLDASEKQLIFDKPWTLFRLHYLSLRGAVKWAMLKIHPTSLGHDLKFSKAFAVVIQRICFLMNMFSILCACMFVICVCTKVLLIERRRKRSYCLQQSLNYCVLNWITDILGFS